MMVTLYKKGPDGKSYYYTLHDRQGSLFTAYTLTVTWGRTLERARERVYTFPTHQEMNDKIRTLIDRKFKQGYGVLYSYFRVDDSPELKIRISPPHAQNA